MIRQYDAVGRIDSKQITSTARFDDVNPSDDGFCRVGAMNAATMTLASIAASPDGMNRPCPRWTCATSGTTCAFTWNPPRSAPSSTGELTYRKDGCTARYRADGIFSGGLLPGTMRAPDGMMVPVKDETLCSPCADDSKGRSTGSGIHPDVETFCDDDAALPSRKERSPSLKTAPYLSVPR